MPRTSCSVLLQGGLVVDGTGRPGYQADVAITGATITAVSPLLHSRLSLTSITCHGIAVIASTLPFSEPANVTWVVCHIEL